MHKLLHSPFDSPEVVEFPAVLSEDPAGPLANLFNLLVAAIGTAGLKPTATGNLPRKTCREIALAHMGEKGYAEYTQVCGINTEPDFPELDTTRFTAQEAVLIRKYKGRFICSRKCRDLLDKAGMRAVYPLLFETYVRKVHWAYQDGHQEQDFLQASFAFTLHLLDRFGAEWREHSFYAAEYLKAFPHLVNDIEPTTYSSREDTLTRMYSLRCLQRFVGYAGLVEIEYTPGDLLKDNFKLRKTPLFNQVVKFHTS
jgi:hypothetical protein